MKTTKTNQIHKLWLVLCCVLLSFTGNAQFGPIHFTMTVDVCAATDTNKIEYNLYVRFDGSTASPSGVCPGAGCTSGIELAAMSFGLNYPAAIVINGGVLSLTQVLARDPALSNLNTFTLSAGPPPGTPVGHLRFTSSPKSVGTGAMLTTGTTYFVGRFRLTSTRAFAPGAAATFTAQCLSAGGRSNHASTYYQYTGGVPTTARTATAFSTNPPQPAMDCPVGFTCTNLVANPPCPIAAATPAISTTCGTATISGTVTNAFDSVRWTTSGTGTFGFPTSTGSNTYTPGLGETSATLTFTAYKANCANSSATISYTNSTQAGTTTTADVCDTYTWATGDGGDGGTYTATGTYTTSSVDASNCITINTLNLTIRNSTTSTHSADVCDSYVWLAADGGDGGTYTASGTYTSVTTNPAGCPNTATLTLIIRNSTTSTHSADVCDSYVWLAADGGDGGTYTASGTYTAVTTNPAGCPNTATLTLIIRNSTTSTHSADVCDSYVWLAADGGDGGTYTASGTYTAVTTNPAGCPNTATLTLIIRNSTTSTHSADVCDSYVWLAADGGDGGTYTASGTYTSVTTNPAGCPNTATLTLIIRNSTTSTHSADVCDSYVWLAADGGDGGTYTASGTYTAVTTNPAGCPNTATLTLIIRNSTTSTHSADVCDSYVWLAADGGDGGTYTASGTYTAVTTNPAGCPNTATLTLIIRNSTTSTHSADVCDSYVWLAADGGDGGTYTASGTYTAVTTNPAGCPNTATLTLIIRNSTTSTHSADVCDSYVWLAADGGDGGTYTASGTYTAVTTNPAGCPNTATLTLIIRNSTTSTHSADVCDSYVWLAADGGDGGTYTASGTYTAVTTNPAGCPNTATLTLIIRNSTTSTHSADVCDSYVWLAADGGDGGTYTASGTYTAVTTNPAGCPNTATLTLIIRNSTTSTHSADVCDSYVWLAADGGDGGTYTASGTYTAVTTNPAGCPNTATLTLIIRNSTTSTHSADVCDSYVWLAADGGDGGTYTASGTYTAVTTNPAGCPNTATLTLIIRNSTTSTHSADVCDSYVWLAADGGDGGTYTASGTYTAVTTNPAGCPNTATLTLIIRNSTTSTHSADVCDSYVWLAADGGDGGTYTASGTYTAVTTNPAGCPNTATLTLIIRNSTTSTHSADVCDSYVWLAADGGDGGTYTASGTYTAVTTNPAGCPNTATLTLIIRNSTTSTHSADVCDSYVWLAADGGDGGTYTASGTYTAVTTNPAGCPNTATLTLIIRNSTTSTHSADVCDSYVWLAADGGDGGTYTASGTYTAVTTNPAGCPNTATLTLIIRNSTTSTHSADVCDSYVWATADGGDGGTYTTSGTYTNTSTNAANCPNTATLTLIIRSSTTGVLTASACSTYVWAAADGGDGGTYTATGVYTYTSTNAAGCPLTTTLTLAINNTTSSASADVCDSYTWSAADGSGDTYTVSGTYTFTSTNGAGCDNTATLTLIIRNSTSSSLMATACNSYVWAIADGGDGSTYTASGTYTNTSLNAANCPQTTTLNLTINTASTSSISADVCDSYVWAMADGGDGGTYTTSGTYVNTSVAGNGCINTATLTLIIRNSTTSSLSADVCDSYTWSAADGSGLTYTTSGTYTNTTTNAAGCTNTATLNLIIRNSTTSSISADVCDSYVWTAANGGDGGTYTASGTYTNTSVNAAGCPHTATLTLIIRNSSSSAFSAFSCGPYVWTAADGGNGGTYNASGTYTNTTTNSAGCPHTTTLTLTVGANTSSSVSVINCGPYTWAQNGQTYSASGTYTSTSINASGCVHTYSLVLTVKPVPATPMVTVNNVCGSSTLTVSNPAAGASILWSNGTTTNSITSLTAATYTVVQTLNGCVSGVGSGTAAPLAKPTVSVTTTPTNCGAGNSGTATANVTGGMAPFTYSWSNGQTTNPATALAAGGYTVTVTGANGCTASSSGTVLGAGTVPPSPTTLTGPTLVCVPVNGVQYCSNAVPGATSYNWLLPAGVTIVGANNGQCVIVNFSSNYRGGNFCVWAVNACGQSVNPKIVYVSKATSKPANVRVVNGPAKLCKGQCATYSVLPVAGATSYNWSVYQNNPNLTITSANGGTSVTVCAGPNFNGGYIQVAAVNCKGQSSTKKYGVKLLKSPGQPGSISGQNNPCKNVIYKYSSGTSSDATSYLWSVSGTCATIVSTSGKDAYIQFSCTGTFTLSVVGVNSCGQSVARTKTVTVVNCTARLDDGASLTQVKAYPNPVKDLLNVDFVSEINQSYAMRLMDMTGRIVYNEDRTATEGTNHMEINVGGLSSGVYMLNFQMGDSNEQIRVIVE